MKRYLIDPSFAAELAKLTTHIMNSTEFNNFVFLTNFYLMI